MGLQAAQCNHDVIHVYVYRCLLHSKTTLLITSKLLGTTSWMMCSSCKLKGHVWWARLPWLVGMGKRGEGGGWEREGMREGMGGRDGEEGRDGERKGDGSVSF